MTGPPGSAVSPALFPIQLEDVYSVEVRAERRDRREDDDDGDAKGSRLSLAFTPLDEERLRFRCRLEVSLVAPVLDREVAELAVTIQGNYYSEVPIDPDAHAAFVEYTPMIQLWPYARGYLSDIGRLLGVNLPPLPLVDVSRPGAIADLVGETPDIGPDIDPAG